MRRPGGRTSVSMEDNRQLDPVVALAAGPIAALIAAGLLARFRDEVGVTNVALVLAMIVMAAAFVGRMSGILTAVTAAMAFNYFHTEPFHSLRINGAQDIVTVLLLAALGLVMSEISAWRRRAQIAARRRLDGARALERIAAMIAAGAAGDEIWPVIHDVLVDQLHVVDCRFEPGATTAFTVLPRSGSLVASSMRVAPGGFLLPATGAAIPVVAEGHTFGYIVL